MTLSGYSASMQVMQSDPDLLLLRKMAQGDAGALERLYTRHGPALLSYLSGRLGDGPLAEEALQDVMLAAWQGAKRFRGESKVKTWLLSIAHRRVISLRRKRGPDALPLKDGVPAGEAGPLESALRSAQREELRRALESLPPHQRETLELVFYHGLSGPEAAEVLGVPAGTVKSRLSRALTSLRRFLEDDCGA